MCPLKIKMETYSPNGRTALTLKELYPSWEWRTLTHQFEGECQNHVAHYVVRKILFYPYYNFILYYSSIFLLILGLCIQNQSYDYQDLFPRIISLHFLKKLIGLCIDRSNGLIIVI